MGTNSSETDKYSIVSDHSGGKVIVKVTPKQNLTTPPPQPYTDYRRNDDGSFQIEVDIGRNRDGGSITKAESAS